MTAAPLYTANPRADYQAHRDEIDAAIRAVLDGPSYVLGENVTAFEAEFAAWCGAAHGVGVNNGTDAIAIGLRALGVQPRDEVITVSHTAVATVAAIEQMGAVPVLVDVCPDTCCIDPAAVRAAVTPATRAIVAVHLYGHPADLTALRAIADEHKLWLFEDCAQAHGATLNGQRVGSFGDAASFSFYPTKNLGAIGDGGMVVTNSAPVAERARLLRQYGWDRPQHSVLAAVNTRLDEMQAAILRVKLRHLDADTARRQAIAAAYDAALAGLVDLPSRRSGCAPVFHLYVIRTDRRDALMAHLKARGIMAGIHYPQPVHRQPAYDGRVRHDAMAVTEALAGSILSLPLYPAMADAEVQRVIDAVRDFFA